MSLGFPYGGGGSGSGNTAIGNTVTSGTTGSVLFVGPGPVLAQDNANFFWDDTNNRLGIGTATPAYKLDINGGSTASQVHISTSSTDDGGYLTSASANSLYVMGGLIFDAANFVAKATSASMFVVVSGETRWYGNSGLTVGNTYSPTEWMRLTVAGKLGIGEASPNVKLQIKGTTTATVGSNRLLSLDGTGTNTFVTEIGLGSLAGVSTANSPTLIGAVARSSAGNTNADLYFATRNATTDTPAIVRMTIQNDGNVGIGTTAPTTGKLVINTAAAGGAASEFLSLLTTYTSAANPKSIAWRDGSGVTGQIDTRFDGTTVDMFFGSLYNSGGYNTTDRMTIKGTGLVGIGTTAPGAQLHIVAGAAGTIGELIKGAASQTANLQEWQDSAGTVMASISPAGKHGFSATNTAGGTTGAQTINKPTGTVNFAAAATSLVVTNSLVSTSSLVYAVVRTNDTTAVLKNVVPASGSFTITMNAAVTAETSVGFVVFN